MSGGVTTNYGFKKPNFNVRPWDADVNNNYDLLDTLLYTLFQIPNIVGMWRNSTAYTVGQNVLDPQSLVFYNCLVANTSAATGTFAADRLANPANWALTQPQIGSVRYDQGQALTPTQIQQALTNLSTLSTAQMQAMFLRFDAAQTLTYNQALQVLNTLGIDGTESTIASAATTDVGNAATQNIVISGSATITSFGTRPNKYKLIRFGGAVTLTNSAILVLPTAADIVTLVGDTCIATSDANGNWYIRAYQRATSAVFYPSDVSSMAVMNMAVNGFNNVSQQNGSNAVTLVNGTSTYLTDQMAAFQSGSMVVTGQQVANPFPSVPGIPYGVKLTCTTASATLGAADSLQLYQPIEGNRASKLAWGTALGIKATVGWVVRPNYLMTAYLGIANGATGNRVYIKKFICPANQDTFIFPPQGFDPDTTGTWTKDNSHGLLVFLTLSSGTTGQGTSDQWTTSTTLRASADITNFAGTVGNNVIVSGLVMFPGIVPISKETLPLLARHVSDEERLCYRYYFNQAAPYVSMSSGGEVRYPHDAVMRSAPALINAVTNNATLDVTAAQTRIYGNTNAVWSAYYQARNARM